MAIKELITLEGVEEIEAKLARLNKAGEDSIGQFKKLGDAAGGSAFDDLVSGAQKAGLELNNTSKSVNVLKDAMNVLRPVLRAAGASMGEFSSAARLLRAGGPIFALGAIAVAAFELGKLDESIAAFKGRLTDLTGSGKAGEDAFNRLKDSAKTLGTTTEALEPSFAALKRGLDDFAQSSQKFKFVAFKPEDLPGAQDLTKITEATDNFFKILRAGRLDSAQAAKSSEEFFTALAAGGNLTADILKKLPVGTVQLLAQALGKGVITVAQFTAEVAKAPIPINKVAEALARFGPQADAAFDAKAIITMGDALNKLVQVFTDGSNSISNFVKQISGLTISENIIKQIGIFRQGFSDSVAQIDAFLTKVKELGATKILGIPLLTIEVDKKEVEKEGAKIPESIAKGIRTAPKAAEPIPLADLVTIEPGGAADVILTQLREKFEGGKEAAFEPLTKVPPFQFDAALASVDSAFQTILQKAQSTWDAVQALLSQPITIQWQFSSNPFLSGQPTSLASGGMVRGAGSTTSDSILAFLSNREFVVNARAVSHYGPEFFAALNAMRLPRDLISRFSMGGLARSLGGNRFAAGGQARSGTPVVLNIDRKSFNMTAGDDTISQLKRFAVASQLSSTGRKPRWVK